ncbi:hypothetical protein GCM10023315_26130 [Algibacter aquimarinus]|uniref:Uncharacterized protein n=1 Tax=Algibacter aquimarinus TaxID=1136748 RepID=A0ABP9HNG9_9FLAO
MEESSIVSGRTNGISLGIKYAKNLAIIIGSKSLPANSLMYSQTVCKIKISMSIINTLKKVLRYVVSM